MIDDSKILSPQEMHDKYQKLHNEGFEYPYCYEVEGHDQLLVFVGVQHIYEVDDSQLEELKVRWNGFLERTAGSPRLVFIEGGLRQVYESEKQAIENSSEGGLLTFWANKAKVEVQTPEPDRKEEIRHLENEFNKDEIMYFYFARQVLQWQHTVDQPEFENYFQNRVLGRYQKTSGWSDYNFSLEHMKELHKKYSGQELDKDKLIYEDLDPYKLEVAIASAAYRDRYILKQIVEQWHQGKSLFIGYGSGHAFVLEPAIKNLATASIE